MVRFLYEMVVCAKQKGLALWPYLYKVNKALVNLLYPVMQRLHSKVGTSERGEIIVSLTSFPGRIHQVWKTVASLLNQSLPPKKVILWLASEQFPDKKLPNNLLRMTKRGLEICWCEDLKSHKKYYETFKQFPDNIVVTADDDIFYPENFLEKLWETHQVYPEAVVCHWSHRIMMDEDGNFCPYNMWENNAKEHPAYATLAVGCNGVLYPPAQQILEEEELLDADKIRKYAIKADDLWLKCMEILSEIKTINCNSTPLIYFNNVTTRKTGLWVENTGEEKNNDVVWTRLIDEYPEVKNRLLREIRLQGGEINQS